MIRSESEIRETLEHLKNLLNKNFRTDKKSGNLIYIDADGKQVVDEYDIDSLAPPGVILSLSPYVINMEYK